MKPTTIKKPLLSGKAQAALSFSEPNGRAVIAPEGHRRLTINLPEALHKKLRQAALDRDCNATDIIVSMLTKDLL